MRQDLRWPRSLRRNHRGLLTAHAASDIAFPGARSTGDAAEKHAGHPADCSAGITDAAGSSQHAASQLGRLGGVVPYRLDIVAVRIDGESCKISRGVIAVARTAIVL